MRRLFRLRRVLQRRRPDRAEAPLRLSDIATRRGGGGHDAGFPCRLRGTGFCASCWTWPDGICGSGRRGPLQWLADPPLTTVRMPFEQIAAVLVERCLREIEEGPTGEPGVYLPTEIEVGGMA